MQGSEGLQELLFIGAKVLVETTLDELLLELHSPELQCMFITFEYLFETLNGIGMKLAPAGNLFSELVVLQEPLNVLVSFVSDQIHPRADVYFGPLSLGMDIRGTVGNIEKIRTDHVASLVWIVSVTVHERHNFSECHVLLLPETEK